MAEEKKDIEKMDHPWNSLITVKAFDQGTNETLNLHVNGNTENCNGQITQGNSSDPLLIDSLIKYICSRLEANKKSRRRLYLVIWELLQKSEIINDSFDPLEFVSKSNKYQRPLYEIIKMAHAFTRSKQPLYASSTYLELSRYRRDFLEIDFIASGGYGKVYQARNYLDGIDYAIKKIPVTSEDANAINQHLKEVKTLALLNHTNIVSYKAAWIDTVDINVKTVESPKKNSQTYTSDYTEESFNSHYITDSSSNNSHLNDTNKQDILSDKKIFYTDDKNTDIKVKELNRKCVRKNFEKLDSLVNIKPETEIEEVNITEIKEETSSDIVFLSNSKKSRSMNKTEDNTNYTDDNNLHEKSSSQEICSYIKGMNRYKYNKSCQQLTILYIQMSLCDQTLAQWISRRSNGSPEPIIKAILEQILCGIDYMHSKHVVHHDIKPYNIFISKTGPLQIQLGDFGLACPLKFPTKPHSGCGTLMYAAPEQLKGVCDRKSDIYSVGIVLTELLIQTQTQMEFSNIIYALKNGNIPAEFPTKRHKWAQMIIDMVQDDPAKRPWTKELLQNLKMVCNDDGNNVLITELRDTVATLKNDIRDKDTQIQELQETVALLEKKVKKLNYLDKDKLE